MCICEEMFCTGCGACKDICSHNCITFEANDTGAVYPVIDKEKCIDCGLCRKVCPNNNPLTFKTPAKVYAAWSKDEIQRRTSASGGIAAEMYKYILGNGGFSAGVTFDMMQGALYIPLKNVDDIQKVKNSKYTFSNTNGIYKQIKEKLKDGVDVLFIGLPCQVAGLLNFLRKPYQNLTTVDIICHGLAPTEYIRQHIWSLEEKHNCKCSKMYFRDPAFLTHKFFMSLYAGDKCFYKKRARSFDVYQLGYHRALIYRDNCYSCRYAKGERISDLTIGDFSGLGKVQPCEFNGINVSCVLVNSEKGEIFIKSLNNVVLYERPIEEALNYEHQLKQPSIPHKNRQLFINEYKRTGNFESSAKLALKEDLKSVVLYNVSPKRHIVKLVVKMTSKSFRKNLKALVNKVKNGK